MPNGEPYIIIDPVTGQATIRSASGKDLAVGRLVPDLMPDATAVDKVGVTVRFVGDPVREQ